MFSLHRVIKGRSYNLNSDWEKMWEPSIHAIGTDFRKGEHEPGADSVEYGAIRRYLEPLEFDCPLHYDSEIAKKNGYKDIIAPYSSLYTWTIPPHWKPGTKTYISAERNAQPAQNPLSQLKSNLLPNTIGYLATDIEIDYKKPIAVGDRLTRVGEILLSCVPKKTKIGYGAFMVWESKIVNQLNEVVAVYRIGTYNYNPYPKI